MSWFLLAVNSDFTHSYMRSLGYEPRKIGEADWQELKSTVVVYTNLLTTPTRSHPSLHAVRFW